LLFVTYQNNIRHGNSQQITYNDDGTVTKMEGTYENDKKNGVEITSCNNEVQSILRYNYGKIEGIQHLEMSVVDKTVFIKSGKNCSMKSSTTDICCVCYEDTKFRTMCNHSLCVNCISSVKMQCPMCRASF
jgi:hypothetical protein